MRSRLRLPTRSAVVAVAIFLVGAVGAVAGCSSEEGRSESDRQVAVYGLVLEWILERETLPAPGAAPDDTPAVFLDHLGQPIGLDVQVGLVGRFEDRYELRFVDAISEAVEEEQPGAPVRHGGLLVGLGAVPHDSPFQVRVEVYRDARSLDAYRFEVARWGGDWVLRGDPHPVEAEGFARE